jgi:hypothetical protein
MYGEVLQILSVFYTKNWMRNLKTPLKVGSKETLLWKKITKMSKVFTLKNRQHKRKV